MVSLIDTLQVADTYPVLLLVAIYAVAAIFSGLSGFGFSAIGALSLVILPAQLGVPLSGTASWVEPTNRAER